MKDDFEVLNDIYEEKLKEWLVEKGKKISNETEDTSSVRMRSLLAMIYLNENMSKISRTRI